MERHDGVPGVRATHSGPARNVVPGLALAARGEGRAAGPVEVAGQRPGIRPGRLDLAPLGAAERDTDGVVRLEPRVGQAPGGLVVAAGHAVAGPPGQRGA